MTTQSNSPLRRKTRQVHVGKVLVGGGLYGTEVAPVVVQSMTNTDTADDFATAMQVAQLGTCRFRGRAYHCEYA